MSAFLLPPLNLLLLGLAGLALWPVRPRLSRFLVLFSLLLLWIFSMPLVGRGLLASLEAGQYFEGRAGSPAQAIVVLGGGVCHDQPEYAGSTVCGATLERLRYAALLHRRTGLPLLVTGGDPERLGVAEAAVMKQVLEAEFGVPVRWTEGTSRNTRENAVFSAAMLRAEGVGTVVLVSQAWHLPRAARQFRAAGLNVIPAGTISHRDRVVDALDLLPHARGLEMSRTFFHEAIGMLRDRLAVVFAS